MFDLESFRWSVSDHQRMSMDAAKSDKDLRFALPRHERGQRFIRGPIPLDWIQAAIPLGRKAPNVAMALWWLGGINQSTPIRLTRAVLELFGVQPESARKILKRMEQAGLVRVARKRGRGPDVVLLDIAKEPDHAN